MKYLFGFFFLLFLFCSCGVLQEWNSDRKENVAEKKVNKAVAKSRTGAAKGCSKQFPIIETKTVDTVFTKGKETIKVVKDSVRFNLDSLLAVLPKDVEYVTLPCKPDTIIERVDTSFVLQKTLQESTAKSEAEAAEWFKSLSKKIKQLDAAEIKIAKLEVKVAEKNKYVRWFWILVSVLGGSLILFLYIKFKSKNIKS